MSLMTSRSSCLIMLGITMSTTMSTATTAVIDTTSAACSSVHLTSSPGRIGEGMCTSACRNWICLRQRDKEKKSLNGGCGVDFSNRHKITQCQDLQELSAFWISLYSFFFTSRSRLVSMDEPTLKQQCFQLTYAHKSQSTTVQVSFKYHNDTGPRQCGMRHQDADTAPEE